MDDNRNNNKFSYQIGQKYKKLTEDDFYNGFYEFDDFKKNMLYRATGDLIKLKHGNDKDFDHHLRHFEKLYNTAIDYSSHDNVKKLSKYL